jgi:peroxiredoxin
MNIVLLLTRLLLAAVFIVSGLAKLADRPGSRQAMLDFGVPTRLAAPFALLLPLAELALAVLLIPTVSAWWGALGTLALLLLFTGVVGYHLTRGHAPSCHCFGQVSSEPIGWPTLLRNLILSALAGVIVGFGRVSAGASVVGWIGMTTVSERVELGVGLLVIALVALKGVALLRMLRRQGYLLERFERLEAKLAEGEKVEIVPPSVVGPVAPSFSLPVLKSLPVATGEGSGRVLPIVAPQPSSAPTVLPSRSGRVQIGELAPEFSLPDLNGQMVSLADFRGKPTLVLFWNPGCGFCQQMLADLKNWEAESLEGGLALLVVSTGDVNENRSLGLRSPLLLDEGFTIGPTFGIHGTPIGVLVDAEGKIASEVASGAPALLELARSNQVLARPGS